MTRSYGSPWGRTVVRSALMLPAGSTSFQTAWALLGLMAAGVTDSPVLARGVEYLLRTQEPEGGWRDAAFTAPGFPRVFYLKYHGYSTYFPLWALARSSTAPGIAAPV